MVVGNNNHLHRGSYELPYASWEHDTSVSMVVPQNFHCAGMSCHQ